MINDESHDKVIAPALDHAPEPMQDVMGDAPLNLDNGDSCPSCEGESSSDHACDNDATVEFGGPKGPEPTRFGDWEQKGRCTDF